MKNHFWLRIFWHIEIFEINLVRYVYTILLLLIGSFIFSRFEKIKHRKI